MISQKAKYAFKALFHLAEMPAGVSSSIEGIANAEAIPRKFLEHILLQLKRGRIVASHRGPHGGYRLIVPPFSGFSWLRGTVVPTIVASQPLQA